MSLFAYLEFPNLYRYSNFRASLPASMKTTQKNRAYFRERLLHWHQQHNTRHIPWKPRKDPYTIWVTEVILQQTRFEYGKEYIQRFLQQYPTIQSLANAQPREVFKLWQGLGYYNRCANMLETARSICSLPGAKFPSTYEDIRALKGVGPYTAAAIASFAFDLPHAAVDGNVIRVLSRYFGLRENPHTGAGKARFQDLAQDLLCLQDPAAYNQGIIDLGATICKPAAPHCEICPLKARCFAFTHDTVGELPVRKTPVPKKERFFHFMVITGEKGILIEKRHDLDIWKNLYQFPLIEATRLMEVAELTQHDAFQRRFAAMRPNRFVDLKPQLLTHQKIHARFFEMEDNHQPKSQPGLLVPQTKLENFAFPKIITSYLEHSHYLSRNNLDS